MSYLLPVVFPSINYKQTKHEMHSEFLFIYKEMTLRTAANEFKKENTRSNYTT